MKPISSQNTPPAFMVHEHEVMREHKSFIRENVMILGNVVYSEPRLTLSPMYISSACLPEIQEICQNCQKSAGMLNLCSNHSSHVCMLIYFLLTLSRKTSCFPSFYLLPIRYNDLRILFLYRRWPKQC